MQPLMMPPPPGGLHAGFPLPAVSQEGISYCDCRRIVFSRSSPSSERIPQAITPPPLPQMAPLI